MKRWQRKCIRQPLTCGCLKSCCIYEESERIESQRGIIEGFINGRDDPRLAEKFVDDGYSETSFDRPGFQSMLEKIRRNEIDCVICKDLSRFGRKHLAEMLGVFYTYVSIQGNCKRASGLL